MPLLYFTHIDRRSEWKAVVTADAFTLGFSEGATLPLPDRTLAAREVAITRTGERYQLRDLAQEDRVLLNGTVTREAVLTDADQVQVGRILLRFYEDPPLDTGQVVLRWAEPDRLAAALVAAPKAGSRASSAAPSGSTGTTDGPPERSAEGRLAFLCVLGGALLLGVVLGFFGWGSSPARAPERGVEVERSGDGSVSAPVAPASRGSSDASPTGTETSISSSPDRPASPSGAALSDLRRHLDARAGSPRSPGEAPDSRGASEDTPVPGARVVPVSHGDPLGRGGEPEDPWVARLRAFRLYLDVAGRPPSREELGRWLSLSPDVQWTTVLRQVAAPPAWIDSVEDSYRVLVGRAPYASELADTAVRSTPERPPGFWVAFGDEYVRPERRRPRELERRAASLVVDLTERVPTRTELAAVRSSLDIPGARDTIVRMLVHSNRSLLGSTPEGATWWEDELFRFLLRRPTGAERGEITRWLTRWPQENRLKWFLTALALYPEYETY